MGNNTTAQYRNALKKELQCSKKVKERLIENFDQALSSYLEDYPAPNMDDLMLAFGPPEVMAKILIKEVTPQEQKQHHRNTLLSRIFACILAAIVVFFTFYAFFFKEFRLTSADNATIDSVSTVESTPKTIEEAP